MQLFKTPHIKFLKYKYAALAITGIIVLAGILNVTIGKGFKLGVDFGEGTLVRVMFKDPISVNQVRDMLKAVGLGNSVIQETGKGGREFQVRSIEVVQTRGQEQEIEAHEELGNSVIQALRGPDYQGELAKGSLDFNAIEEKSLAALLEPSVPGRGEELAKKIISFRNERGIIRDVSELQDAAVGQDVLNFLKEKTFLGKITILSRETVGPQVGHDLRRKATQATIWALIGMLAYIAFRFKLAYGVSAIFTLTQDVLITMSIFTFTNREINLPIIAGILTIVGYSINDTIVIFDRVRELSRTMRKESLEEVMNAALNQTLSRTLITSGTVFLTILALFLFGGEVINDFAFIMLIGTIEGVYSTIYLSCPVVLFWHKAFKTKKGFRK
jgi:preprotein translocase subunit SecF